MRNRSDLPFSMKEYEERLERVRRGIAAAGLDALLVTSPANIYYLTGYETQGLWMFNGLVVPVDRESFMVVRHAEDTVVEADTWVEISRCFQDNEDPMAVLAAALREFQLDKCSLGHESDSYYFRNNERLGLKAHLPDGTLKATLGIVEALRLRKSPRELEYMRRAARATAAGMRAAISAIREGAIENEVAAEAYSGMLRAGSHYCPVAPWVASGPRSFLSHATWRDRRIGVGDCVFLEFGGCVYRYQTGMMRSVFVGGPNQLTCDLEKIVKEAMNAALAAIRPGVPTGVADAAARKVISASGHTVTQYTRVGYSMGLAFPPGWGEGHMIDIKPGDQRLFEEDMTFHLIPFLQVPNSASVAMSETIHVTKAGCELLTDFDRQVFYV